MLRLPAEARHQFWQERSKTSAISKHTNAFKLNEDVVIPLDKIGEYTDACERFNIRCSIQNKTDMIDAVEAYLRGPISLGKLAGVSSQGLSKEELAERKNPCGNCSFWIKLNPSGSMFLIIWMKTQLKRSPHLKVSAESSMNQLNLRISTLRFWVFVQNHLLRISWKKKLLRRCTTFCRRQLREAVREQIKKIHDKVLRGRVFIALHMHAGDGNVHTNIPVNSDDIDMLRIANEAVVYVMGVAKKLGGAISGEHGIGMTKVEFVEPGQFDQFYEYLDRVDPQGHFNKGKLRPEANLSLAYTPSFNLLGHESIIMQKQRSQANF